MKSYLDCQDEQDLQRAKSFEDLLPIALRMIKRLPSPVGEVCGPMTSGGLGSVEANFQLFRAVIDRLSQDIHLFDQTPFERTISRIAEDRRSYTNQGDMRLLEVFYLPIFQSGLIKTLYFLPSWRTSRGARWERHWGRRSGLEVIDLSLKELGINPDSFRPR